MALTADDKKKFAEQEQEIALLRGALDKTKTELERVSAEGLAKIKALAQDAATLRQERDAANDGQAQAQADVLELNAELTKASSRLAQPAAPEKLAHDGRQFQLTVERFNLAGEDYTRADVTEGSALLARLVELRAGILEEVPAAE